MKNLTIILALFLVSACQVNDESSGSPETAVRTNDCFAQKHTCDSREIRMFDGTELLRLVKCESNINTFRADFQSLGLTVEDGIGLDGNYNTPGPWTRRPHVLDIHISVDDVHCTIDGEGPSACSKPETVFAVLNTRLNEVLIDKLTSYDESFCERVKQ